MTRLFDAPRDLVFAAWPSPSIWNAGGMLRWGSP
jgi:hypothetical protein